MTNCDNSWVSSLSASQISGVIGNVNVVPWVEAYYSWCFNFLIITKKSIRPVRQPAPVSPMNSSNSNRLVFTNMILHQSVYIWMMYDGFLCETAAIERNIYSVNAETFRNVTVGPTSVCSTSVVMIIDSHERHVSLQIIIWRSDRCSGIVFTYMRTYVREFQIRC